MAWNGNDSFISDTTSIKCPNCGANVIYNAKAGKLVCGMCGGLYDPIDMKLAGRMENRDVDEAGEPENDKQEFVCDSCGAALVTDYNTSATFCAFCGSPTLIKRRLTKCFRPDCIIPFKITKEEAIEKYRTWAKAQRNVPKEFLSDEALTKITGFYVPFWLIDADCNSIVTGTGRFRSGSNCANFQINRRIRFKVREVPFDGCRKISNLLMEAIEPFDYVDLKEYSDVYLPGFYAQRYDQSAIDMLDNIYIRLDNYAESLVKNYSVNDYSEIGVTADGSYSEKLSQKYALMPVWFLNIKYKGMTFGIAVNGQTGEASGNLPTDKKKANAHIGLKAAWSIAKYLLITAFPAVVLSPLAAVFLIKVDKGSFFLGKLSGVSQLLLGFLLVWILASLIQLPVFLPLIKEKIRNQSFKESVTIDQAPQIEHYIDLATRIEMEKNDSFLYTGPWADNDKDDDESKLFLSVLKWIVK